VAGCPPAALIVQVAADQNQYLSMDPRRLLYDDDQGGPADMDQIEKDPLLGARGDAELYRAVERLLAEDPDLSEAMAQLHVSSDEVRSYHDALIEGDQWTPTFRSQVWLTR
jgi:hypothetical protein